MCYTLRKPKDISEEAFIKNLVNMSLARFKNEGGVLNYMKEQRC